MLTRSLGATELSFAIQFSLCWIPSVIDGPQVQACTPVNLQFARQQKMTECRDVGSGRHTRAEAELRDALHGRTRVNLLGNRQRAVAPTSLTSAECTPDPALSTRRAREQGGPPGDKTAPE